MRKTQNFGRKKRYRHELNTIPGALDSSATDPPLADRKRDKEEEEKEMSSTKEKDKPGNDAKPAQFTAGSPVISPAMSH